MIPGIPRISVYIITYNQEDVIERTLGSILSQRDYVYEICVSDDHSSDRTWEILQEYDKKFPGLFKLNRNDPNLGIFENTEKVWSMPTGDIVHDLAGDDCVGEGWFKQVVDYIQENRIDYKNELFCIYGDYICKYPNGDSIKMRNNLIQLNGGQFALKMALRGIITNRSTCYSINILKKFKKVSQGRSHIAEDAQDRQLQIFSEKNYYIPYVGNIYYAYVGISTHVDDNVLKERNLIRPYAFKLFEEWGVSMDKKDRFYSLVYFPVFNSVLFKPTFYNVIKLVVLYLKCYDSKIGLKAINIRSFVFAIRRRLPHKKPLVS